MTMIRNQKRNSVTILLVMCISIVLFFSSIDFVNAISLSNKEKENADTIGSYMVDELDLNPAVAFGILGNIYKESHFDPSSVEGGYNENNGGIGICQWTNYPRSSSSGRNTNMKNACKSNWKEDMDGQLKFMGKELEDKSSLYSKLKKLPNNKKGMEEACWLWLTKFEIPGGSWDAEQKQRFGYAEQIFKDLDGKLSGYSVGSSSEPYDFSLIQELLAPVVNVNLSDGSLLSTTDDEKKERRKINTEILKNTSVDGSSSDKMYSLYDRFGPKLQFLEYQGEVGETIELADHVISAYITDNDKELKITDDILKYTPQVYLSTSVYKDRPPCLDVNMVKQGYLDSRVELYKENNSGKLYTLSLANRRLAISTAIVGTINLFTDNRFFDFIFDTFKKVVQSSAWDVIKYGVNAILSLFIAVFIVSLISHAIRFSRGKEPAKLFFIRAAIGCLSIGLVSVFLNSPTDMLDNSKKVLGAVDSIVNENVSFAFRDDPVVFSSDGKHTMQAAVWNTALFEPWCQGTFGDKYENLYTQFAKKTSKGSPVSEDQRMPQSYEEDHENPKLEEYDDLFYDSATCTGDVFVDLGKGKERNWAAYALSTLSIYHIGHEVYEEEKDTSNYKEFPNALTTYREKNLYADTFRWIDAKMNISPQYLVDEENTVVNNYGDSSKFETHYYKYSWEMLWHALLLSLLIPVLWMRLKAFLGVLYAAVKGVYYSLVELLKENTGLSSFWEDLKDNLLKYAYHTIQLYMLLFLYITLLDMDNFLFDVLFIFLSFVISGTSPRDLKNRAVHLRKDIKTMTFH